MFIFHPQYSRANSTKTIGQSIALVEFTLEFVHRKSIGQSNKLCCAIYLLHFGEKLLFSLTLEFGQPSYVKNISFIDYFLKDCYRVVVIG